LEVRLGFELFFDFSLEGCEVEVGLVFEELSVLFFERLEEAEDGGADDIGDVFPVVFALGEWRVRFRGRLLRRAWLSSGARRRPGRVG